ncbi:MAG: aminoglycoside phosphotransferase family protein [Clostridiales bacterium]|nr:aminoglycoside phosphotransferase family protein [Clostridiales bacterium]
MKAHAIDKLIIDLVKKCGLGVVDLPIEQVSGGCSHRMYKVKTDCGVYAVKRLNPNIMSRADAHDNFARAEKIEQILEKEDIPIVPAIMVDGKKMQNIEGNFFYIFRWQEGRIADWNNISSRQCNIAGSILGKIHAISPQNIISLKNTISPQNAASQKSEVSRINWREYVSRANEERSGIAPVLSDNENLLIYAEQELNKARAALPDIMCMSDADLDPKNIMWENGKPWVIDLECLDYENPVDNALQLALQWSGIVTCDIDIEKMLAFFDGYLKAYDNGFRAYSKVYGLAYTWVEWLEYNIKRALGECIDEEEKLLGVSETKNTINRIKYAHKMEKEIKAALDLRLPRPD